MYLCRSGHLNSLEFRGANQKPCGSRQRGAVGEKCPDNEGGCKHTNLLLLRDQIISVYTS